jgi:hypothetical protein
MDVLAGNVEGCVTLFVTRRPHLPFPATANVTPCSTPPSASWYFRKEIRVDNGIDLEQLYSYGSSIASVA